MPRVSIIMNVRNGAAYLREALDSVMAQTFQDWDLIVFDDRSTDESAQIVAEYQDKRIRYVLSPEDVPLGRARNQAIGQAKGEWLAFLDQDDIWELDKLKKQMALVEGDPSVGIIYGRTVMFSPHGGERDYDYRHEFQPLPEGDIFLRLFTHSCFISMSSAVLRRSAVEQVGPIPDCIELTPDYYYFTAIARRNRARAVQEVVCRYRVHPGNASRLRRVKLHEEILWLTNEWAPYLDAEVVARRLKAHHTRIALDEMCKPETAVRGLSRLLTRGSVPFLLWQPFARAIRAIRRRVQRPYWKALH